MMSEPNPGLVFDLLNSYQRTAALRAGVELDVFGALGKEGATAAAIAKHSGVPVRGIRILCDFLTITGLLEKSDGKYVHTPTSAVFLDPASPASMAPTVPFLLTKNILHAADLLTETIRKGHTALQKPIAGDEVEEWVMFAKSMHPMMAGAAEHLAEVGNETGPTTRVLDVASSHGLFGMAFAKRNADTHVTALDFETVLEVTKKNVTEAGLGGQYSYIAGSAFTVDMGGPYDVVLVTNLYHHFDIPTCEELMRRFHDVMAPGARMLTLEMVPNEDRVTPVVPASFSMMMLQNTPSGDAYTLAEYEMMLTNTGFKDVELREVPLSAEQLVVAVK
ncbi:MAG: class I SAM-dependent methyltransferase [Acidobacteriota bacterium]